MAKNRFYYTFFKINLNFYVINIKIYTPKSKNIGAINTILHYLFLKNLIFREKISENHTRLLWFYCPEF